MIQSVTGAAKTAPVGRIPNHATVERIIVFIEQADASKLVCANYQHWLVRDDTPTSWPSADYKSFVRGVRDFWTRFNS